jgi:hypothetical protein
MIVTNKPQAAFQSSETQYGLMSPQAEVDEAWGGAPLRAGTGLRDEAVIGLPNGVSESVAPADGRHTGASTMRGTVRGYRGFLRGALKRVLMAAARAFHAWYRTSTPTVRVVGEKQKRVTRVPRSDIVPESGEPTFRAASERKKGRVGGAASLRRVCGRSRFYGLMAATKQGCFAGSG